MRMGDFSPERALPGFGELDLDLGDESGSQGEAPPESTSRTAVAPKITRRANDPVPDAAKRGHEGATRHVRGGAPSAVTRSQPPPPMPQAAGGAATRMGTLDEDLLAVARGDDGAPASE